MSDELQDAIVVLANWFQFGSSERITQPCVESRMLLWCRAGKGTLTVNGVLREFAAGDWIFLSWRHQLIYQADEQDPFLVGAIHLIPHLPPGQKVDFVVNHDAVRFPGLARGRSDWKSPQWQKGRHGHFEDFDRLPGLMSYVIERHHSEPLEESALRCAAQLLLGEIQSATRHRPATANPISAQSHRMREYVRVHLNSPLSVERLARVAGCSVMGVHRHFRNDSGLSPGRWIAQIRAQRAAVLLRTTRLPIAEIGREVGLPDPFHFSRFFKRQTGESPRAYRESRRLFRE